VVAGPSATNATTGARLSARTREDQSMTATGSPLTTADLAIVAQLARQLRIGSIRASTSAGSGHPTSSMSATDVLAVLVAHHLR
jgi:transketolase